MIAQPNFQFFILFWQALPMVRQWLSRSNIFRVVPAKAGIQAFRSLLLKFDLLFLWQILTLFAKHQNTPLANRMVCKGSIFLV